MANVYDKLKEMNITLPAPPPKGGVYTPVMEFGDHLLYCSGCGPDIGDGHNIVGKVGGDLTLEQGQKAAYNCMLNLLANLDGDRAWRYDKDSYEVNKKKKKSREMER